LIYIILFFTSFISASLFPFGSEALLIYNIKQEYNIIYLLFFATTGNVLGSLFNYFIGFKGEEYLEKRSYIKKGKIDKYKSLFNKYGPFCLLLSWAPIIGDPITLVAGVFKYDLKKFLILVFLAKFGRYIFITLLAYSFI